MYAFAINRIQRRDDAGEIETISANSVFKTVAAQLKTLEAHGAAREATADEVAIAKDNAERAGNAFVDPVVIEADAPAADTTAPASGAKGDPKGKPTGANGDPKGKPTGAKVKDDLEL